MGDTSHQFLSSTLSLQKGLLCSFQLERHWWRTRHWRCPVSETPWHLTGMENAFLSKPVDPTVGITAPSSVCLIQHLASSRFWCPCCDSTPWWNLYPGTINFLIPKGAAPTNLLPPFSSLFPFREPSQAKRVKKFHPPRERKKTKQKQLAFTNSFVLRQKQFWEMQFPSKETKRVNTLFLFSVKITVQSS